MKILFPERTFFNRRLHKAASSLGWDVVSFGSTDQSDKKQTKLLETLYRSLVQNHTQYDNSMLEKCLRLGRWEEHSRNESMYLNNVCELEKPDFIFPTHLSQYRFPDMAYLNDKFSTPGVTVDTFRSFQKYEETYGVLDTLSWSHPEIINVVEWNESPSRTDFDFPVEALSRYQISDDRIRVINSVGELVSFFSDYRKPKSYNGVRLSEYRNNLGTDNIIREHLVGDSVRIVGTVIDGIPNNYTAIDVKMSGGDNQYQIGWSWPSRIDGIEGIMDNLLESVFDSEFVWPNGPFSIDLRVDQNNIPHVISILPKYDFYAGEVLAHACDYSTEYACSGLLAMAQTHAPVIPKKPTYMGVIPFPVGIIKKLVPGQQGSGIKEVVSLTDIGDRVLEPIHTDQFISQGYAVAIGETVSGAELSFMEFVNTYTVEVI